MISGIVVLKKHVFLEQTLRWVRFVFFLKSLLFLKSIRLMVRTEKFFTYMKGLFDFCRQLLNWGEHKNYKWFSLFFFFYDYDSMLKKFKWTVSEQNENAVAKQFTQNRRRTHKKDFL